MTSQRTLWRLRRVPKLLDESAPYALVLVLGLAAGLFLEPLQSFKFIPQITLGQAVQTAALLLIFMTAHRYYEKAHDRRRKRIEILANQVNGILVRVDESHEVFLRCADNGSVSEVMRFRLDSALREYSNAVRGLEDVLKQSGHLDEATSMPRVKDDRAAYRTWLLKHPILIECLLAEPLKNPSSSRASAPT